MYFVLHTHSNHNNIIYQIITFFQLTVYFIHILELTYFITHSNLNRVLNGGKMVFHKMALLSVKKTLGLFDILWA